MNTRRLGRNGERVNWIRRSFPLGMVGALALFCVAFAPSARAQDIGEYSGGTGVSAGTVTSTPQIFTPGGAGQPNSSITLAKPTGPPPEQVNREWFARQAGKNGAQLAIDAVPPQSRVWIDGKFVGQTPLTVTLPAGKHHVSIMGSREEHADREVDIASGKNQRVEIHLAETYPTAVSIPVFGNTHQP